MTGTHYIALIPHPKKNRVLLLNDGQGNYTLPQFATPDYEYWQTTHTINRLVEETLGLQVTVLRCLGVHYDPVEERSTKVYAMENHSPAWKPPSNGQWVTPNDDGPLGMLSQDQRAMLDLWFEWMNNERGVRSVPWYRFGWYNSATEWIRSELDRLGYTRVSDIRFEQIRSWERSSLIRVQTAKERMYFKAVPDMFRYEPAITKWLAEGYPKKVPRIVTNDLTRGWMLMHDFGDRLLDQTTNTEVIVEAMRQFGKLQANLTKEADTVIEFGCPDRRLETILEEIDDLLDDTEAMLPGQSGGLSDAEIIAIQAAGPRLKGLCEGLADCGLPHSLEHGDFYLGQIAFSNDNYIFFDWSDCSLSHPFFSLCSLLDFIEDTHPEIPAVHVEQMIMAYFEAWEIYASPDRLMQALDLARPVAALHCALLYHRFILPKMEVKWEMERMLPMYLRKVLYHINRT